jgi:hypothetical protein
LKISHDRVVKLLAVAAVAVAVACSWYPPIQTLAQEQVDAGLSRALVSFASARTLNALISVIQGTEVAIQPLGIGVTLTLGQILDPVNDLVEQFSDLMLSASVAFGIQKVLLTVASNWVVSVLVTALAAVWATLFLWRGAPLWLSRALVIVLLIRFAVPVVTIGSDFMFTRFLAQEYDASQQSIVAVTRQSEKLAQQSPATRTDKSLVDQLKDRIAAPITEVKERYEEIKLALEQITVRIINLIVIFLMQTIVVPMVLFWVLLKVAGGVLRWQPARSR